MKQKTMQQAAAWMMYTASAAGLAMGTYHGYKRNQSVGWALWWAFWGSTTPYVTIPLAFAQGFAKPREPAPAAVSGPWVNPRLR